MSLTTAGGGLGGMGGGAGAGAGGLTMAHSTSGMAPAAMTPPTASGIPGGENAGSTTATAPPSSAAAALGADLIDKSQSLSRGQVQDLSKFPIVALDLHAQTPMVAGFPPKPQANNQDDASAAAANSTSPFLVGKMKTAFALKTTETSHKTFRKWLNGDRTYRDLQADSLAKLSDNGNSSGSASNSGAIEIHHPQRWLGIRRVEQTPPAWKQEYRMEDTSKSNGAASTAIAEEASHEIGVSWSNSTLDGSAPSASQDDADDAFDRAVAKLKLTQTKKPLTALPEELTGLILQMAQHHVAKHQQLQKAQRLQAVSEQEGDEDDIIQFPCAIAVPAIYCHDAAMEALQDATTNASGVFFQRSLCALEGALLPSNDQMGKPNLLLAQIQKTLQTRREAHQREVVSNPDAQLREDILLLLAGVTRDSAEVTAVEISGARADGMWGNFRVLSSVSYRNDQPLKIVKKCISDLFDSLDTVAPEADTPVAMVTYGTPSEQSNIQATWESLQKSLEDWEEIPNVQARPEAVALGTAVLGAVSHGRLATIVQIPGKKRPKVDLAIHMQNVAPSAVGITLHYHGGNKNHKWTPVKTVFDFDRRVPAGPYAMDLVAAEFAVHRTHKESSLSEEDLLKAIQAMEGAKCIPQREQAALDLRVQVMQKKTRDDEWEKVGNIMSPLVSLDKDEKKIACEKMVLELSLGPTGMISNALVGERESVVQANTSARNSKLRYYIGIILAVGFFGGLLFKSWYEDRVFERDTRRLLAYYKNVIPGSMSDGDLHNARYVVYKYRNKKHKLWKNLEKKYGVPVLEEHEWSDADETSEESRSSPSDEEEEDLDEKKPEQDL